MSASPQTFDCVIIGAGVIGLTLADELLRQGQTVCLVDRQQPGQEASWAGAGILPPGALYEDARWAEDLAKISGPKHAALSDRLQEELGVDDGFSRSGAVYLAGNQHEAEGLSRLINRWRPLGIEAPDIDRKEIIRRLPAVADQVLRRSQHFPAYDIPGEAQVRNPWRLRALVELCRKQGATMRFNDAAHAVEPQGDALRIQLESGVTLSTAAACVTAGAWSGPFALDAGARPTVKPLRGQMLLLEVDDPALRPTCHLHIGPLYVVPRTDGKVLLGSTVEDVGFDKSTTPHAFEALTHLARDVGLTEARILKSWAGLRPASSDGAPLIGPSPRNPRVYLACGHFRAGLQFAPATAMLVRQMMLGQPACMDPTPFRLDR